jgi:pimeloyl-ACP methyl ester carboxylesterase
VFASREEALMRYATRPGLSVLRADALAAYVNWGFVDEPDGTVRLACSGEAEARTFEANSKLFADDLGGVKAPVTIAAGRSGGELGPALFAPPAAAALPLGQLVEYDQLGHFGPVQDPDFIADEILRVFGVAGPSSPAGT